MDFDAQSFGLRLKGERQRLGLSQQVAADRCGVRREMWGKYERGVAEPGVRVAARMGALGADVLYLLLGRFEAQFEEGEGRINPVEIATIVFEVKAAFDRQGLTIEMYDLGAGTKPQSTYLARIVNLAGEIYNEVRTLGPGDDATGARRNMASAVAIAERGRFGTKGAASGKVGTSARRA